MAISFRNYFAVLRQEYIVVCQLLDSGKGELLCFGAELSNDQVIEKPIPEDWLLWFRKRLFLQNAPPNTAMRPVAPLADTSHNDIVHLFLVYFFAFIRRLHLLGFGIDDLDLGGDPGTV